MGTTSFLQSSLMSNDNNCSAETGDKSSLQVHECFCTYRTISDFGPIQNQSQIAVKGEVCITQQVYYTDMILTLYIM